jgi:hypothetical protein
MYEQRQTDQDGFDFAEIWRTAQYGRTDAMSDWFSRFFGAPPRIQSADLVEPQSHQVTIAA